MRDAQIGGAQIVALRQPMWNGYDFHAGGFRDGDAWARVFNRNRSRRVHTQASCRFKVDVRRVLGAENNRLQPGHDA